MKDVDLDALHIAFGNISLQDHSDIDSMVNRFEIEASNILDQKLQEQLYSKNQNQSRNSKSSCEDKNVCGENIKNHNNG